MTRMITGALVVLVAAAALTDGAMAIARRTHVDWTSAPEAATWGD